MKKDIIEIAERNNFQSIVKAIEGAEEFLPIIVGFLGEWSSGKSTLVNALIGKKLLPVGVGPTTKSVTEIYPKVNQTETTYFEKVGDDEEEIDAIKYSELATGSSENRHIAIINIPESNSLPYGYGLVDTPGLQSLDETDTDITFGYLPFLDGVVFCVNAEDGGLKGSIVSFLEKTEVKPLASRIVIALTHADAKPLDASVKIHKHVIQQLREYYPKDSLESISSRVVLVDGKSAMKEGYLLEAFKRAFDKCFVQPKETLFRNRLRIQVKAIGQELREALSEYASELEIDDKRFKERKEETERDIKKLNQSKREYDEKLRTFHGNLIESLEHTASTYLPRLQEAGKDDLKEVCGSLIEELNQTVKSRLDQLDIDIKPSSESGSSADIYRRFRTIIQSVEFGKMIGTAILLAIVSPAATGAGNLAEAASGATVQRIAGKAGKGGAAAGKKTVRTATNSSGRFKRAFGGLGKVLDKVNPVNMLGDIVEDQLKASHGDAMLKELSTKVADFTMVDIRARYDEEIFQPMRIQLALKKEALEKAESDRFEAIDRIEAKKNGVKNDIKKLDTLLT